MTTGELISSILVFVLAAVCLIIGIRHFMGHGFLLNNAYIYASKKERESMDKKPYYRQTAIIFCLLCIVFVIIGLSVVLQNSKILLIEILLIAAAIIYAILSTRQINKTAKK